MRLPSPPILLLGLPRRQAFAQRLACFGLPRRSPALRSQHSRRQLCSVLAVLMLTVVVIIRVVVVLLLLG